MFCVEMPDAPHSTVMPRQGAPTHHESPTVPRAGRLPLPPGPSGTFGLRGGLAFLSNPLASINDLRDRYGDTSMGRLGHIRIVFVHNPEDVHYVLVQNHRNYIKSRSYDGLRMVMGNGLVTSEGDFWRRQRRMSQPAFHRRRLESLGQTMVDRTELTVTQWRGRAAAGPLQIDFHAEMMRLTLGIVGQTLFGIDLSHESSTLGPAVSYVLDYANQVAETLVRIPLWVPTPANLRFRRQKKRLDATVHKIIAERRRHPRDEGDLLSMLMAATAETGDDRMTDTQLRDEVMTLFLAGHETIATAMSWTFALLSEHPEVAQKLRDEVDEVIGTGPIRHEDLVKLHYTGWVINESMRVYPPVWIVEREAIAEDTVGGYRIPKGTIVAVPPWGLHHSPKLWSDPERFDPERFSPERVGEHHRYAYLPFGAGPRMCIGNNFALMEAKIIVAALVRAFDIDVVRTPRPLPRVTLRPNGGMRARVVARRS